MKKIAKISIVIILLLFAGMIFFFHSYTIVDGKNIHQVISVKNLTANQAVKKAGILVENGDLIIPTPSTKLHMNVIEVIRSKPVELCIDGKCICIKTTKQTVGEALEEAEIKIGEKDSVSPNLSSKLYTGEKITISTYKTQTKIVKIPIPYKTVYEENSKLQGGKVINFREGKDGVLEKKFLITYVGGKKVSQKLISEKVESPAISSVYMVGKANPPSRYVNKMRVISTAYSPRVIETDGNPWCTATGIRSAFGVVAVDPKVIPLGTLMYVEGYGYAVAGDTGSAIKGNKIDVFFYSTSDAYRWGRRTVTIYILPGKWTFPDKLSY